MVVTIAIAEAAAAGLSLAEGLAAAAAIYGKGFNGALSLKALTFFEDGDPPSLDAQFTLDRPMNSGPLIL